MAGGWQTFRRRLYAPLFGAAVAVLDLGNAAGIGVQVMPAKPKISGSVVAGFPSPAEQYLEPPLDLNELLVKRPAATFFVRVQGLGARSWHMKRQKLSRRSTTRWNELMTVR